MTTLQLIELEFVSQCMDWFRNKTLTLWLDDDTKVSLTKERLKQKKIVARLVYFRLFVIY